MTAHSSQASAPSEGGGNADSGLSDGTSPGKDLPPARPENPERALMNALLAAADALDAAWRFAGSKAARDAVLAYLKTPKE